MHDSSMKRMAEFAREYDQEGKTVIDIGSLDINGTYRDLFSKSTYIGVDIVEGANVDMIMDSEEWDNLKDIDIVISGQTLEHVEDVPKLMKSIFNVLKSDGIICMIAPSAGLPHEQGWFGNFSEERMTKVVSDAGFHILSCIVNNHGWYDTCCIATKMKEKKQRNVTKNNKF